MKKVLLTLSVLIIASFMLSACSLPFINVVRGSGNLTTESRQVSGFNAVRLDGAGKLVVTQGDTESLTIEAEDNIISDLKSTVQGNTLVLGIQESFWHKAILPTRAITYTLTVKDLNKVTFNGAGDLEMDELNTSSVDITINGAGQASINTLNADSVAVQISGTGNVQLAGEVNQSKLNIDGAGNVQAGDLKTANTTVIVNGLGNGTVWATNSLDVTINGGGTLGYYGSPDISQNINGAGNINNLGDK
jgi:predicted small secreted protein